jgi:hypothetical protein
VAQYNLVVIFFINKSTKSVPMTQKLPFNLRPAVSLSREHKKVNDTLRVTPFVIVPSNEFDKVLVQLNASISIKDAGSSAADEVGRDNRVLSVIDDAFEMAVGSRPKFLLDLIVSCLPLEADDEVND